MNRPKSIRRKDLGYANGSRASDTDHAPLDTLHRRDLLIHDLLILSSSKVLFLNLDLSSKVLFLHLDLSSKVLFLHLDLCEIKYKSYKTLAFAIT